MFGKHFTQTYTGSMHGAGLAVFGVWGYVIANTREGMIELNAGALAPILGCTEAEVEGALTYLESPDPRSRNPAHEGRRLVKVGPYAYEVPSWNIYRNMRDENDRRKYQREYMRTYRADAKAKAGGDIGGVRSNVRRRKPPLAQAEEEVEAEVEARSTSLVGQSPKSGLQMALVEETTVEVFDRLRNRVGNGLGDLQAGGKIVLGYFNAVMQTSFRWGGKSSEKIITRLREIRDVSKLLYAIDGATRDDTIMGRRADSPPNGYKRPSTVFRDSEQVERFLALARDVQPEHPILSEMITQARTNGDFHP